VVFYAKYGPVVSIAGPSTYSGQFFVMKRTSPGDRTHSETIKYMEVAFPWFPRVKGENEKIYLLADLYLTAVLFPLIINLNG